MMSQRGIEANLDKIQNILNMQPLRTVKEVQCLTRRLADLSCFISKATNRYILYFKILRGAKKFKWTEECQEAFMKLKEYLSTPPLLSKPICGELLSLYFVVSTTAVSSILIREEDQAQRFVYCTSHSIVPVETKYPVIEKLALALLISSRNLKPYFETHTIVVPTSYPLK